MILFKGVRIMETQTIITVLLALVSCYRLVELLIKIIIGFVVMLALFVIVWGVCESRRKKE